ncbi:hypothetical protein TB1_031284 [Malus domestica]
MDRQEETSKLNNYEVTAGRGLMNVVFSWSLEDVLNPHLHQNQVGDRIALTDTKPKCVDRFNRPRNSYLVANVHRSRGNNLSILSSKLIDRVGYMQITSKRDTPCAGRNSCSIYFDDEKCYLSGTFPAMCSDLNDSQ